VKALTIRAKDRKRGSKGVSADICRAMGNHIITRFHAPPEARPA
jgi:hypothetical protein